MAQHPVYVPVIAAVDCTVHDVTTNFYTFDTFDKRQKLPYVKMCSDLSTLGPNEFLCCLSNKVQKNQQVSAQIKGLATITSKGLPPAHMFNYSGFGNKMSLLLNN